MPMPTVDTSFQQTSLIRRYVQPRELTTTHTSGRQNKILGIQVPKRLLRIVGIASCEEGRSRRVWSVDISTSRLSVISHR